MGEPLVCHLDSHCLVGTSRCYFYARELTGEDYSERCAWTSPRSFVCDLP
jgi:hypothetical protein